MDAEFVASLTDRFPRRQKYLVGVSGGRDSVALLHLLHTSGYRHLVVGHLNHGLRGRASGDDARFVRRLSERWEIPYEIEKQNITALAASRKRSVETVARFAEGFAKAAPFL